MDLPTLEALEAQWTASPPVHVLVASYLGYKPAVDTSAQKAPEGDGESEEVPTRLQLPGVGSIPAPAGAHAAATSEEAAKAFEQMFFGEVKDVEQLRRT